MESVQFDQSKLTWEQKVQVFRCVQFECVCAPVWCACPCVLGCAPVQEGMSQCRRVCPSEGGCVPVREGVSHCGKVCPSEGGCVPLWEGVSQ